MKPAVKIIRLFSLTVLLSVFLFSGCPMLQGPVLEEDPIDYYSKLVEYNTYIDPAGYYLEPVETRVFHNDGALSGIFRYYYEPFTAGSSDWVLKKTEVYEVNEAGNESLSCYYVYTYVEDSYTEYDEDDLPYTVTDYLLSQGESYAADDFRYHYYTVTYADFPNEPDRYLTIVDMEWDDDLESFEEVARQTSTYKMVYTTTIGGDTVNYYDYVTEKYFDTPPDEEMMLSQEFACWYEGDTASPLYGLWTHELFHTFRSSEGNDEVYYYTKYDWNEAFQPYKQQDFLYDSASAAIPVLSGQPEVFLDGTYDDAAMDAYELEFDAIGDLHEELTLTYDDLGNIIRKVVRCYGSEHERVVYRYNNDSEELSMARYIQGKSTPYDRVETRYRDEYRDEVYYRVREEVTYMSEEAEETAEEVEEEKKKNRSLRSGAPAEFSKNLFTDLSRQIYRPIRSNHER